MPKTKHNKIRKLNKNISRKKRNISRKNKVKSKKNFFGGKKVSFKDPEQWFSVKEEKKEVERYDLKEINKELKKTQSEQEEKRKKNCQEKLLIDDIYYVYDPEQKTYIYYIRMKSSNIDNQEKFTFTTRYSLFKDTEITYEDGEKEGPSTFMNTSTTGLWTRIRGEGLTENKLQLASRRALYLYFYIIENNNKVPFDFFSSKNSNNKKIFNLESYTDENSEVPMRTYMIEDSLKEKNCFGVTAEEIELQRAVYLRLMENYDKLRGITK